MKKKYYKTPVLVTGESTRGVIPAAIAAGVASAASSVTAATAATVGGPLLAGYAIARGVKSAMEFHPNEPILPALKKVYD